MSSRTEPLALASTSRYRAELLKKLGIPFYQFDPGYTESPIPGELPEDKALRLAQGKAVAGARTLPVTTKVIVIGSDQVAHCDGQTFSKPGNFNNAFNQLEQSSGNWVSFSTAVCLVDGNGTVQDLFCEEYALKFRKLDTATIRWYLETEAPFDCAGSIKAEALGITLIEDTRGQDVNTLYGLPLIKLFSALQALGVKPTVSASTAL